MYIMAENLIMPGDSGIVTEPDILSRFLAKKLDDWQGYMGFDDLSPHGPADTLTVDDIRFDRGLTFIKRGVNLDGSQGTCRLDIHRYPFRDKLHWGWGQILAQREQGDWERISRSGETISTAVISLKEKIGVIALLLCSRPVTGRRADVGLERERFLQTAKT
jgi:hypothetical protein